MAIFFENAENAGYKLAIWKTEESAGELCGLLGILPADLPSRVASRQKEWLAIRILLKKLLNLPVMPAIDYDEKGKPALRNSEWSISISHSKEYVCVLVSSSPSCGVDLEIIDQRIKKIASRFLSDEESRFIGEDFLKSLHVIWGAKEVLYKLHARGGLSFKEHLKIEPFVFEGEGQVHAQILKPDSTGAFSIAYRQIGDLMLAYVAG